jgi:hypothetical protein
MATKKVNLGNPYRAAPAPHTGGDPLNRMGGNYGKSAKPVAMTTLPLAAIALGSLVPLATTPKKAKSAGKAAMRGLKGGVGPHVKQGGLGPGRLGGYGSARHYDKNPLGEG